MGRGRRAPGFCELRCERLSEHFLLLLNARDGRKRRQLRLGGAGDGHGRAGRGRAGGGGVGVAAEGSAGSAARETARILRGGNANKRVRTGRAGPGSSPDTGEKKIGSMQAAVSVQW